MKEERLPVSIDPVRFAKTNRLCSGVVNLRDLPRLCESMTSNEGVVFVAMRFFSNEESRSVIELKLKSELSLSCQRCLGEVKIPVDLCHYLVPVKGLEEAERLPSHLDPVWMEEDDLVNPLVLIEDDLILAIPLVPMHPEFDSECVKVLKEFQIEDLNKNLNTGSQESVISPFSVLSDLKNNLNNKY